MADPTGAAWFSALPPSACRSGAVITYSGPGPATHVALHIVPMAWVDGSAGTDIAPLDLAWNWSDVVRSMPAAR